MFGLLFKIKIKCRQILMTIVKKKLDLNKNQFNSNYSFRKKNSTNF